MSIGIEFIAEGCSNYSNFASNSKRNNGSLDY